MEIYFAGNGYIEGKEIDNFLKEFITSVDWSEDVGVRLYAIHL